MMVRARASVSLALHWQCPSLQVPGSRATALRPGHPRQGDAWTIKGLGDAWHPAGDSKLEERA